MKKRILPLLCSILFLFLSVTPAFADTPNETSTKTQTLLKNLIEKNGTDTLFIKTIKSNSEITNASPNSILVSWTVTAYKNGTLRCVNNSTGAVYTCNYNTSYVGYGYTTSGSAVIGIQCLLCLVGYPVTIDGQFGSQTYNAIYNFQYANRSYLTVDGVAGPATFNWAIFLTLPVQQTSIPSN
jgi:peptidoglycan hydrolase-like protein with peptidoglycan-binding domain